DLAECRGKGLLRPREEVLPERLAAADLVLPHPRLRFVDAQRTVVPARRAEVLRQEPLFVQPVPGLVQDAAERLVEESRVVSRGDPAVAGADPGAERMGGDVEPARLEVEPDRLRCGPDERLLDLDRVLAFQHVALRLAL